MGWPLLIRRVRSHSMQPTLAPGQLVIGSGWLKAREGNVVILKHAGLEKVKRVASIKDGEIFVAGDNPAQSIDSHSFGWLPEQSIRATVIWPRKIRKK